MRRLGAVAVILAGTVALAAIGSFADDTVLNARVEPPEPIKGEDSRIRMVEEELDIYFSLWETTVDVRFHLQNLTQARVRLKVGFPDTYMQSKYLRELDYGERNSFTNSMLGDIYWWPSPAQGFRTWLDTRENALETKIYKLQKSFAYTDNPRGEFTADWEYWGYQGELKLWHTFDVVWEPTEMHVIGHSYRVRNGHVSVMSGMPFFSYWLGTGSTWAGTIGRLEANVYLLGGLTADDMAFEQYYTEHPEWEIVSPTHLRLVWDDFEPAGEKASIEVWPKDLLTLYKAGRKIRGLSYREPWAEVGVMEVKPAVE